MASNDENVHERKFSRYGDLFDTCKLMCCYFILGISYVSIMYLSAPIQRYYYLSNTQRTWIPFVFFLSGGITAPFFGHLSDVNGPVKVLTLQYSMSSFSAFCAGLAPDYTWFVLLLGISGAFRMSSAIVVSMATQLSTTRNQHWNSLLAMSDSVSGSVVGFVPLMIDPNKDWRLCFMTLMFLPNFLGAILMLHLQEPSERKKSDKIQDDETLNTTEDNHVKINVTLSQSVRTLYQELFVEFILVLLLGFLVGVTSGPLYNMASEFSHYVDRACVEGSDAKVVSIKCSDMKILSPGNFVAGMVSPLATLIFTIPLFPLMKFTKLGNIVKGYLVLQSLVSIGLFTFACREGTLRHIILFILPGICNTVCFIVLLFCSEILPVNCRGFGSSVLLFSMRVGDYVGYVLIESTMYEHFKAVLVCLIIFSFIETLISLCLQKSRHKGID